MLVLIIAATAAADWIAPFNPSEQNLDRILHGGRVSLLVGGAVAVISGVLGTLVGLVAGLLRRPVDTLLMRLTDTLLALPALMVVIMAARILGDGVWGCGAGASRDHLDGAGPDRPGEGALSQGTGVRGGGPGTGPAERADHVLSPAAQPGWRGDGGGLADRGRCHPRRVDAQFPRAGREPAHTATWGNMLGGNEGFVTTAPWLVWAPGVAIVLTALCVNFIGDGLRDSLDPTREQI